MRAGIAAPQVTAQRRDQGNRVSDSKSDRCAAWCQPPFASSDNTLASTAFRGSEEVRTAAATDCRMRVRRSKNCISPDSPRGRFGNPRNHLKHVLRDLPRGGADRRIRPVAQPEQVHVRLHADILGVRPADDWQRCLWLNMARRRSNFCRCDPLLPPYLTTLLSTDQPRRHRNQRNPRHFASRAKRRATPRPPQFPRQAGRSADRRADGWQQCGRSSGCQTVERRDTTRIILGQHHLGLRNQPSA